MGTHTPEREAVLKAYGGKDWQRKVMAMSDSQVFAIFARLKSQGRIK